MEKKIDKVRRNLRGQLSSAFMESSYSRLLIQMYENGQIGADMKKALYREAKSINLKWNQNPEYRLLTFEPGRTVNIMDVLRAFQPKHYFSHHSAMYFHELTDQRPEEYFLAKEITGREPIHSKDIVPARIRQAFLKAHRKSQNFLTYRKAKITLLEKQDLDRIGVIKKSIRSEGSEIAKTQIYLTSIERTLVDSVISPQYCGGLKTVLSAFSSGSFSTEGLYSIYKVYSPYYPYWQSIGFILERLKGKPVSEKWLQYFSEPTIDFYLDRNFREDWEYDPSWRIYFPKGIFG